MYTLEDTIAAIATPHGESAIGIIRISGNLSKSISNRIFQKKAESDTCDNYLKPRFSYLGYIIDPVDLCTIDEVILTYFPGPRSFSGEDIIEINAHGGPYVLNEILQKIIQLGARLAEPGEFTFRAFMNGKIDLTQAEAIADVISAKTRKSLSLAISQMSGGLNEGITSLRDTVRSVYVSLVAALDFPEEDIPDIDREKLCAQLSRCEVLLEQLINSFTTAMLTKEGFQVPITGVPNVGKSSLMNLFLNQNRVIVSPTPGTTRDSIEEFFQIDEILLKIIDTAGIRSATEAIEIEGVKRTYLAVDRANLLIVLLEPSSDFSDDEKAFLHKTQHIPRVLAHNKTDLSSSLSLPDSFGDEPVLKISVKNNSGITLLKKEIISILNKNYSIEESCNSVFLGNLRQKNACSKALVGINKSIQSIHDNVSIELIAFEIEQSIAAFDQLLGKTTPDYILGEIFSNFCIGK